MSPSANMGCRLIYFCNENTSIWKDDQSDEDILIWEGGQSDEDVLIWEGGQSNEDNSVDGDINQYPRVNIHTQSEFAAPSASLAEKFEKKRTHHTIIITGKWNYTFFCNQNSDSEDFETSDSEDDFPV